MAKNKRSKTSSKRSNSQEASTTETTTSQFQQEYGYVLRDLRWVFILAAAMFALLIALNLLLR